MSHTEKFYITSGIVPAGGPSYVTREADALLLERLIKGEFCYVLTSRQMGKSSLMSQMVKRLRERGAIAVVLDLSSQGFQLTAEQWYNGLLYQLGRRLKLEFEIDNFRASHAALSPLQLWQQTLQDVVLKSCNSQVTIFIDEIDVTRSLPFSTDEFFAAIRSCYNARSEEAVFAALNFCLLGVATPLDLISNASLTPFNIGRRIDLSDFTRDEASVLEYGLGQSERINRLLMDRIYYWTGGHPYLTQQLSETVSENDSNMTFRDVDACVARLFLSAHAQRQNSNLLFVRQRMVTADIEQCAGQLTLYSRIVHGAAVEDSDTTPFVMALKLAGIVRGENGRLIVRNRIYGRIFDARWAADNMPDAEKRRQRMAYRRGFARAGAAASTVIAVMGLLILFAFRAQQRANSFRVRADNATVAAQLRLQEANRASYALTMNLIQREWDLHDITRVNEMLESTRNSEYRGFEWGYWNHLCHLDLVTLKGHSGHVNVVAFSPDGERVATGGRDDKVIIWDAHSGQELLTFTAGPLFNARLKSGVTSIAFSPDGKRIASACNNRVTVCEADTGRLIWMSGPNVLSASSVAFSSDGKRIAAGVSIPLYRGKRRPQSRPFQQELDDPKRLHVSCVIKVWEASTGRDLLTIYGHVDGVKSVAFSPDCTRIASGSYDQTAKIWDAKTGRQLLKVNDKTHVITSVAFSPDGSRLVTAFKRVYEPDYRSDVAGTARDINDSTVRVWNTSTGREMMRLTGYNSTVRSVAFSPDGKQIATAAWDNTARMWDARTGREQLELRGHTDFVDCLAFSRDGRRLVTSSYDHTAKVWDTLASQEPRVLTQRMGRVTSVAVSKDGRIAAVGTGSTPATWEPTTGRENVSYTKTSPSSKPPRLGNVVEILDPTTGGLLCRLTGHTGDVTSVAISPKSDRIVSGSYDGTAKVWNAKTGRIVFTLASHEDAVTGVAFSPDGCRIATCSLDKTAKIWDAVTGHLMLTLKGHSGPLSTLAISPDGKLIVTGSLDKTARIWDAITGKEMRSLTGHTDEVLSVAFSPDGGSIITGSADNSAIVWSVATGNAKYTLKGHSDNVNSVAYSSDGKRIITGSDDHAAKIWDAETGQDLLTLTGHSRAIHGVCFSPNGLDVITGSWDKTTRIWHSKF